MTVAEVKKLVGNKKLIIGTDRTLTALRKDEVKKVFMASNCPKGVRSDVEHYAKLTNVEVALLDIPNDELGVVVKKPFSVSVIALLK